VEGSIDLPWDIEEHNNDFIQENFNSYYIQIHQPNFFISQLPNNCETENFKFDMQNNIIFREHNRFMLKNLIGSLMI
jgi:hypothetical protein